eukprot:CAMPEP_0184502636 /NCGR_PEP_ID=MMETSP0113_2-20130426/50895_1 /TAXON_ID=91329 /ORGANISM="Norrisiella sphaerica, Strain BC52" /LENGTH=37 /DNA_ID= /DNA_START= /DNA_END= /DNA_ORIENTATION=
MVNFVQLFEVVDSRGVLPTQFHGDPLGLQELKHHSKS